jgi:hypothetical protein
MRIKVEKNEKIFKRSNGSYIYKGRVTPLKLSKSKLMNHVFGFVS